MPYLLMKKLRVKFIQDNSPIHKAIVVRQWFREHPTILSSSMAAKSSGYESD